VRRENMAKKKGSTRRRPAELEVYPYEGELNGETFHGFAFTDCDGDEYAVVRTENNMIYISCRDAEAAKTFGDGPETEMGSITANLYSVDALIDMLTQFKAEYGQDDDPDA
jgi:hypothetical protein